MWGQADVQHQLGTLSAGSSCLSHPLVRLPFLFTSIIKPYMGYPVVLPSVLKWSAALVIVGLLWSPFSAAPPTAALCSNLLLCVSFPLLPPSLLPPSFLLPSLPPASEGDSAGTLSCGMAANALTSPRRRCTHVHEAHLSSVWPKLTDLLRALLCGWVQRLAQEESGWRRREQAAKDGPAGRD